MIANTNILGLSLNFSMGSLLSERLNVLLRNSEEPSIRPCLFPYTDGSNVLSKVKRVVEIADLMEKEKTNTTENNNNVNNDVNCNCNYNNSDYNNCNSNFVRYPFMYLSNLLDKNNIYIKLYYIIRFGFTKCTYKLSTSGHRDAAVYKKGTYGYKLVLPTKVVQSATNAVYCAGRVNLHKLVCSLTQCIYSTFNGFLCKNRTAIWTKQIFVPFT